MFPSFRITKAQRQVMGGGFSEGTIEVLWPTRGIVSYVRAIQPRKFFDLMSYHRPVYTTGGHRGPSRKQRDGYRRQSWQRRFRH